MYLADKLRTIAALAPLMFMLLIAPVGTVSATTCAISGTIEATFPNDPGFEGLYKYTINVSWDTGANGLSHASIFLGLENLECRCHPGIVLFDSPAGTSNGEECNGGLDPVYYEGMYVCMGDPTIPEAMNSPAIKFEHTDNPECEPAQTGTGTFVFYSPFPPAPFTVDSEGLGVKYGTQSCLGELVGTPPLGDCSVPAEASSWGTIKSTYE